MPVFSRFLGGGDARIARAKRPQQLRAKWGRSTKEGLDWLRRPPLAKALRTGAPIVPFVLAGTEELYRGKRIAAKILAPVSIAELLGSDWPGQPPGQDTRAEMSMAKLVARRIADRIDAELPPMLAGVTDPPDKPRRWKSLTRLMR